MYYIIVSLYYILYIGYIYYIVISNFLVQSHTNTFILKTLLTERRRILADKWVNLLARLLFALQYTGY